MITRFAPSPTGRLHVGNLRTALLNALLAMRAGGEFWLRLDDTDAARSEEMFVDAIRADLDWFGLTRTGEVRQSARGALYERRFAELAAAGRVYPAYETPQELDLKRKVASGRGLPPIYDRAALALSAAERARFEADGTRPHWRFKLAPGAIGWVDLIRGEQRFDAADLSDPVVRRADGSWLYLLPSAIDDLEMRVSHIVRGEDHVANTAVQIQMMAALGGEPPVFAHAALLTGAEGKLSKRLGSLGADHFREGGVEPAALASLLARLGTSDPVEAATSLDALAAGFDLSRFGRAPARFDEGELGHVNARVLHQLPFEAVAERLPAGMDAANWAAVRPNLTRVSEAAEWQAVIVGPVVAPTAGADSAYLAEAAAVAAAIDWAGDPWHALTAALAERTGRKGRVLFLPLRLALTGRDKGPDMATLLPLIGRERALARLGKEFPGTQAAH